MMVERGRTAPVSIILPTATVSWNARQKNWSTGVHSPKSFANPGEHSADVSELSQPVTEVSL
jgi:hypothetical protein